MVIALRLLWGRSLKRDLDIVMARPLGRASLVLFATAGIALATMLGVRVARAIPGESFEANGPARPLRVNRPAPDIALIDQHGREVKLSDFGGRQVALTFVFAHCETICPAVVSGLRAMRARPDHKPFPIIVVTLDPWRDTPERLPSIAEQWQLAGDDRVLSGSVADVERLLDELQIARTRDPDSGDIMHGSTVMLVDEAGRIAWRADSGGAASWEQLPFTTGI
jgi:protein SCO1/2